MYIYDKNKYKPLWETVRSDAHKTGDCISYVTVKWWKRNRSNPLQLYCCVPIIILYLGIGNKEVERRKRIEIYLQKIVTNRKRDNNRDNYWQCNAHNKQST